MSVRYFTDGEPWTLTAADLSRWWGAIGKSNFLCGMCMHRFEEGDVARWVYTPRGAYNLTVCESCDGPDIVDRWADRWRNVITPILQRWGLDQRSFRHRLHAAGYVIVPAADAAIAERAKACVHHPDDYTYTINRNGDIESLCDSAGSLLDHILDPPPPADEPKCSTCGGTRHSPTFWLEPCPDCGQDDTGSENR